MAPAHWSLKLCRWKALSGGPSQTRLPGCEAPANPRLPVHRPQLCPQAVCWDGDGPPSFRPHASALQGAGGFASQEGSAPTSPRRYPQLTATLASRAVARVLVPGSITQAVRNQPCVGGVPRCVTQAPPAVARGEWQPHSFELMSGPPGGDPCSEPVSEPPHRPAAGASARLSRSRLEFRTGRASWVYLDGPLPLLSSPWS